MGWIENWGPGLWVYFDDLFHAANMASLFVTFLHVRVVLFKEKKIISGLNASNFFLENGYRAYDKWLLILPENNYTTTYTITRSPVPSLSLGKTSQS